MMSENHSILNLFNHMGTGILIVSPQGIIQFANSTTQEFLGRTQEELLGAAWEFPLIPQNLHEISLPNSGAPPKPIEMYTTRIEWGNSPAYLITLRDITERKQAEEDRQRHELERQYAQKLESLGVLAGGIAHDFNNLLMTIVARAGLALRSLPPDAPAREHLRVIEKVGLEGGELANQMLTFAGQTQLHFQSMDFSLLAKELKSFLRSTVSKRIRLKVETASPVPPIRGDRAQLRQMLLNVTVNAAEAIGEQEGTISITISSVDSSTQDFRPYYLIGDLPWGPCVSLKITDTGKGIPSELIPKIFDPFFTTKLPGRGLGLAAILGIVRAHGAALAVRSQQGAGTEFLFLFPASQRTPVSRPSTLTIPDQVHRSSPHRTNVLIVDDEEDVREACALIFREMGLECLVASGGQAGLQLYKQYQHRLALVLLDLTMPGLDGGVLYKEIRLIDSAIPILVSSGFAQEEAMKYFPSLPGGSFIQKPFQIETLIEKVQNLVPATLLDPDNV